jgi:hypothetical protein
MPPPYEGSMSNASMGEWGSHATTSFTIRVPHEILMALHPMRTMCGSRTGGWSLHGVMSD